MWPNPLFPVDFVTFTEEIHDGKLHFLCSGPLILTASKVDLIDWPNLGNQS